MGTFTDGEDMGEVAGAGEGDGEAGREILGVAGTAGAAGATAGAGEVSLNASAMSASGQPTERKLVLMEVSASPEASCCLM